jgi:Zn-dependent protease with chaperone function
VKLDSANNAFLAFIGLCVTAFVAIGAAACALLAILGYRLQQDGLSALTADGDLRPALIFFGVVVVGDVLALLSLRRQWRATRGLAERIRQSQLPVPVSVADAAGRANLSGRVELVDSEEAFSLTYGLWDRRVAVSRTLVEVAAPEELDAVLDHERYHVRHFDPLKLFVLRTLTPMLFFVPALRGLRARYVAGRELAADRHAIRHRGRRPLAAALLKVVSGSREWADLSPAAALGGSDLLDVRITQLETGAEPPITSLSRGAIALSVLGVVALGASFAASLYAFGGPTELARRVCGA